MIEYGLLECTVTPGVKATETIRAMDIATGTAAPETTTAIKNQFGTAIAGSGPEFSAIAVAPSGTGTGTEVTFTGENFAAFGNDCQVTVLGVNSTSCTITATGATATFENGLPVTSAAAVPELALITCGTYTKSSTCDTSTAANGYENMNRIKATPTAAVEGIVNLPSIAGSGSAGEGIITPSTFGGGAEQIIAAPGLKASILAGKAKVEVCGRPCVLLEALSTADQVVCETPAIQTTASVNEFTIEDSAAITGELQESPAGIGALAFDGLNLPGARNSGTNCYIGTKFEGQNDSRYFVGVLNEVRFFMGTYPDKAVFNGKLKLQGSD
jgi:hypothetical protein